MDPGVSLALRHRRDRYSPAVLAPCCCRRRCCPSPGPREKTWQAVYGLVESEDESVMSAGTKALHNVLLRAQGLRHGVDHVFARTVRSSPVRP